MKNTITIKTDSKAITVINGKAKTEVPYVSTAKGVRWYVSKGAKGDYIAIGFKVYANGETRANIYLHDYTNKYASLKTLDGKALETIAKATPMPEGKKYTVTNLSPEGLKNFAVMFASFEASRVADNKTKAKPEAKPTKASKPESKPTAKPTKAKASKPTAKPENKPTKASKPEAKPTASKPEAKPENKPEASEKTA